MKRPIPIADLRNHVIIAGYGVAGHFVVEFLRSHGTPYVIVEMNPVTCDQQRAHGVAVIEGDISDEHVLRQAGIAHAKILALTIPDEDAAIRATEKAHALRPEIHIIASTRYTSSGLTALQKGADEVIVAEQAVAQEFYRRIQGTLAKIL